WSHQHAACHKHLSRTRAQLHICPVGFNTYEQKAPEYLAFQPFGKVPLLEEDGVFAHESRAVCKYLTVKYNVQGIELSPDQKDVQKYVLFEQACSIETEYFEWLEFVMKDFSSRMDGDDTIISILETVLAAYETILSMQKYLAGDELHLLIFIIFPTVL
ncbi:hypothetical protein L207DRAFT_609808, partial [Hyaloscypha variabilis F]